MEATRASAASARDQIETERFAATVTRTALLKAIEAEQQKLEQAKAETSAARLELEKAAVAARSLDPQRRELAALRAEFEEILTRKRERETAIALLTPEVQSLAGQKDALTGEVERQTKRADALRW